MPGVLRMLASRGVWAGLAALAFAAPATAQSPDDPIAASNQIVDPWMAPTTRKTAVEAPWLVTSAEPPAAPPEAAAGPAGKALLARITSPSTAPIPQTIAPEPVIWSAPVRRPIASAMPIPTRPMVPCEPVIITQVGAPPMETPLPPPRMLAPNEAKLASPPPPQATLATATPNDEPTPRTVTTIRFLDDPPKPAVTDEPLMAIIRRSGAAAGTAADIRAAVERVCRGKSVACQTEVAGERQVRVLLTVHTAADWQRLYERMQNLPELGEYGLLFQVQVESK